MTPEASLARLEAVVDRSGVANALEVLLPSGGRPRQLPVRTLLLGMLLAAADGRPAHLTRVHRALVSLPGPVQRRLSVIVTWRTSPHLLSYRQVERTFALVSRALAKSEPDGVPSDELCAAVDALLEASVPFEVTKLSTALAVDWSDLPTFARPPPANGERCADPEASWGRRASDAPGPAHELFFGYEISAATMVSEESGLPVPEIVRRILVTTCAVDPPAAFVAVLDRLAASGARLGDVLADSGYAHRVAEHWAVPLRRIGAELVTDLHPHDRGPRGTFAGATVSNGNLYCPAAPRALLELGPLARGASRDEVAAHDRRTAELAHYKLGRISAIDADGYHRVMCPAAAGKLRCPLRPESLTLSHSRPTVLRPPEHAPVCCSQQTVTVPPEVTAKTAQKHDYPSRVHRLSYARRTAVERSFSRTKDRASTDMTQGWCRVMGVTAISLFAAAAFVVRNINVLDAFALREAEDERRRSARLPLRRRRRRTTLEDLAEASAH